MIGTRSTCPNDCLFPHRLTPSKQRAFSGTGMRTQWFAVGTRKWRDDSVSCSAARNGHLVRPIGHPNNTFPVSSVMESGNDGYQLQNQESDEQEEKQRQKLSGGPIAAATSMLTTSKYCGSLSRLRKAVVTSLLLILTNASSNSRRCCPPV